MKKSLLCVLLLGVLGAGAPWVVSAEPLVCERIFLDEKSVQSDDRAFQNVAKFEDVFTKARSLKSYRLALGESFAKSLEKLYLLKDGHWFDSGAGHAIAVRQALELPKAKNLKATIVAYETSAQSEFRLKVLAGRFLENIGDHEIPSSHLITDVFGPLAYSSQPTVVIQKYLNNLKENGEIYLFLGSRHELFGLNNKVVTASGKVLTLAQWLEQIPGTKAELIKTQYDDDGSLYETWTMRITKIDSKAKVPLVEIIHFEEGAPPAMTFREVRTQGLEDRSKSLLRQQARVKFKERTKAITVSEFFDAFRGGEISHPLISSIKNLKKQDQWVNLSEVGDQVLAGMKAKDYQFKDTKVFVGLAQKFIRWRASRINADKLNYTAVNDSSAIKSLRNVKLLTDYYGDFMSSFAPDVILKRYINALDNRGEIYIYLGAENDGFGSSSVVMTKSGEKLPLREWLESIPGLDVKLFRGGYEYIGGEWTFMKITISDREDIKIPTLKMMGTTESKDALPIPFFEEI